MKAIILFVIATSLTSLNAIKHDPDEFKSTRLLIESKGYPSEEYNVTTPDGYILTVHRIPNPNKPVVFLQHGLLEASHTWVMNFPLQSLAFILYDEGYDVWMGNMRGNKYGLHHTRLTPDQDEFWDFSWSDMAEKDLPTMIECALKISSQKDLIYIGHSQGTVIAFSQLGINPRLASQIKLFIAMGPVAQVSHIKSPIKLLADIGAESKQLIWYKVFGKKDFMPSSAVTEWMSSEFCNIEIMDKAFCENLLLVINGPSTHLNVTRIPVYDTHNPAGTSTKNMIHFTQMVISGKFQKYDFGSVEENMAHYNQTDPPMYDLGSVKTPVALYWATNDWIADPKDVEFLKSNLPNIVDDYYIQGWNHLDLVIAADSKVLLYNRVVKLMEKYRYL